jgi:hypothetical protein
MSKRSFTTGLMGPLLALSGLCWLAPAASRADERPPDLYHTAPVIPWARSVGEHRFRSPRNYDDTLLYYRKVLRGGWSVSWKKIINVSGIRGQHIQNRKADGRWEGLNVYEYRGATFVYVVFTDAELKRQAEANKAKADKQNKRGKKSK